MKIELNLGSTAPSVADVVVLGTFSKKEKQGKKEVSVPALSGFLKDCKDTMIGLTSSKDFTGDKGTDYTFDWEGQRVLVIGLGEKSSYDI
ncbi:MAG: hypothetical protein NXH75_08585, partial [Halobacteriovoraceae bacterium]|nr:hypothetical protein [Halobacteriovoraceae bacterium]